ncbi:AsnC family transcriptional regulator [Streptomyces sp. NPDC002516]
MARVSADSVLSLVDRRLVAALQCDGRLTAERAAQVLGLSPATVLIRSDGLPAAFEGGQARFGHLRSGGALRRVIPSVAHVRATSCLRREHRRTSTPIAALTSWNIQCGCFRGPRPAPG